MSISPEERKAIRERVRKEDADRKRLRKKQDKLIDLAERAGYPDHLQISADYPGSPTLAQLKAYVYPQWESSIESATERVKKELRSRGFKMKNPEHPSSEYSAHPAGFRVWSNRDRRHYGGVFDTAAEAEDHAVHIGLYEGEYVIKPVPAKPGPGYYRYEPGQRNPRRMPGEPDESKLLAKARKPGNNIRTMARIQQQAHDWGIYSVSAVVHDWMQQVGATQQEMERYWKGRGRQRNPKVPGIKSWNTYAGGTFAARGKHSYDLYIQPGNLAGGQRQYSISPISSERGRHQGYQLSVAGSPDSPGLHQSLGMHRSPQAAAKAAREHYEGKKSNPRRRNAGKWVVVDEFGHEASVPRSKSAAEKIADRLTRVTGRKHKVKEKNSRRRRNTSGRFTFHIPARSGISGYQLTVTGSSIDDARREVSDWYRKETGASLPVETSWSKQASKREVRRTKSWLGSMNPRWGRGSRERTQSSHGPLGGGLRTRRLKKAYWSKDPGRYKYERHRESERSLKGNPELRDKHGNVIGRSRNLAGRRRNRSVSMLVPRVGRRRISAVERRIASALKSRRRINSRRRF